MMAEEQEGKAGDGASTSGRGMQDAPPQLGSSAEHKPWFVYPLLALAICAVSSAAVAFSSMAEVPPLLLASWRLQVTATLLVPLGLRDIVKLGADGRRRMVREGLLVAAAGLLMGSHFGSWVICIESTSLTHALLAGSTPPILIAAGMLLTRAPISRGEVVGTGVAALGAVFIAQSAHSERAVSWYGDAVGLLASLFFVLYLSIGRSVRGWLPIFAYVLPVNLLAAASLCAGAAAAEGAQLDASPRGLLGWLGSWHYAWRVLYLGAVPGIVGHVTFNFLLTWLHPLIIALPGTLEPLIGSLLGLALGVGTLPGLYTYVGGAILLGSTVLVIFSAYQRERQEGAAKQAAAVAMVARDPEQGAGDADAEAQALLPAHGADRS